jgi:hypothetical protein
MSGLESLDLGGYFLEVASDDGSTGSSCGMLVYRTYAVGDRQFLPILENTEILRQCPHFLVIRGDCRGNRSGFFFELSKVKGFWVLRFLPHFLHALQSYYVLSENFIKDLLVGFLGADRLL